MTDSEVRVDFVPSSLMMVEMEVMVLIVGVDGSLGGCDSEVSGGCWGDDELVLDFFVVEGGAGRVEDGVELTAGGVDVGVGEGDGTVELGFGGADDELGGGTAVVDSVSEVVTTAASVGSLSSTWRCCIAFTSPMPALPLKVASATEMAESPTTSRSTRRLICIVGRY